MTTVTPATSRRARKKQATRGRILDAAIRLFGERGIDPPTVEEIAAACDVGKGTIYNYFQTKEEIVVAFLAELEGRLQGRVAGIAGGPGPLARILARFVEHQLRLKAPYREFVRVFLAQLATRGRELAPHVQEMQKAVDPPLLALLAGLQKRGLIRRDLDGRDFLDVFKTIQLGIVMVWLNDSPPFRGTFRMVDREMKWLAEGLGPSTGGGR